MTTRRYSPIRGIAFAAMLAACPSDDTPPHVGEPCTSSDEDHPRFGGFDAAEINVEAGSSCGARSVCLMHRFQGRVSCPEGQEAETGATCTTPSGEPVTVDVPPQDPRRPATEAAICSCRCDGPVDADYCECPAGMRCEELILGRPGDGFDEFLGSYCVY